MRKVEIDLPAPNFRLKDFNGKEVMLLEFKGEKHVLLVFNRGLYWKHCRAHLAQLRQDYQKIIAQDIEILSIGPEKPGVFKEYWEEENIPFTGLPDPKHTVLKRYGQQIKIFQFGRMPAQALVDKEGIVRFKSEYSNISELDPKDILAEIDKL